MAGMDKHFRGRRWRQLMIVAVRQGDPGEEMTWQEFVQCVLTLFAGAATIGITLAVLVSLVWLAWRIVVA